MSEKWTKGPWCLRDGNINDATGKTIRVHGVALPCGYVPENDESYGNTRLIAAAPELYDALELIYGRLLMSDRDGECRITAEDGEMAELALKKARGEL
ncbi:MAG TPA: hypothetical protein VLH56_18295 [Dissulfurispiraceae bacterium]|nr:hypothetical protein [Dissulfurispiraceae bacterium]